jgi:proline dehydrogenase
MEITKSTMKGLSFDDTAVAFSSKTTVQLHKTYWIFALMNQNWLVKIGTFFIKVCLKLYLPVNFLIKNTIFGQFCGGESVEKCQKTIENLAKKQIGTILDYSVEGEDNELDFENTKNEILKTIYQASKNKSIPFSVFKVSGIGSVELLEKIQESPKEITAEEIAAYQKVKARVFELCQAAADTQVRIFIDAEGSWIQDIIDTMTYEMMQIFNVNGQVIVYNTFQLYRTDSLDNLQNACLVAKQKGYLVGAKLVRGAYIEAERQRSHELEYKDPIHFSKADTDKDFNKAIEFALHNRDVLSICLGTHNEYSSQYCAELMDKLNISHNDNHIWFAQLLGMSDNISYVLAKNGYNVAKYVPYGPVEAVMPYLFRRAEENKAMAGQSSREFVLVKKEMQRRSQLAK